MFKITINFICISVLKFLSNKAINQLRFDIRPIARTIYSNKVNEPAKSGTAFRQVLDRLFAPLPHDVEQQEKSDHADHVGQA